MTANGSIDDPDPRLTGDHVRTLEGSEHALTLVGVVHDHPSSIYRVREVVAAREPAVLAVELPPLAVPLFRTYAEESQSPPEAGGEMSAAIQAAETSRVVGIDGPSRRFLWQTMETLYREGASPRTIRRVGRNFLSALRTALTCRAASAIAPLRPVSYEKDSSDAYEATLGDAPAVQAKDERQHLGRAQAVMDALRPPPAARLRDEIREAHMADRLGDLRKEGQVVAIVGRGHLDALEATLARSSEQ